MISIVFQKPIFQISTQLIGVNLVIVNLMHKFNEKLPYTVS